MIQLTKADLTHMGYLINFLTWLLEEYPEMFTEEDEDEYRIVRQMVEEKL